MEETARLLLRGQQNRHTAATNMNRESSRSHSVFTCVVECKKTDEAGLITMLSARVNLVDLAGTATCNHVPSRLLTDVTLLLGRAFVRQCILHHHHSAALLCEVWRYVAKSLSKQSRGSKPAPAIASIHVSEQGLDRHAYAHLHQSMQLLLVLVLMKHVLNI